MDNKKKSQKRDEKDANKTLLGKRHDDSRPNTINKKGMKDMEEDKINDPEKRIEIDDNPEETERKIPRMKH